MNVFLETFLEALVPVITAVLEIGLVVLVFIGIQFVKKHLTKLGVELESGELQAIEDIIWKAVVTVKQDVVDDLKASAPNGKLTDEQKKSVYDMAYTMIESALSEEQIELIKKVYGNSDNGMNILIENKVVESKMFDNITKPANTSESK